MSKNAIAFKDSDTLATIPVPFNVTVERVKDLLTSAFEGGSNYWIESAERVNADRKEAEFLSDVPFVKGGCVKIKEDGTESKDGKGGWFNVDVATITKGLAVFAEKYPKHFADFVAENDDACTADVFLQCVCFGEAIYG